MQEQQDNKTGLKKTAMAPKKPLMASDGGFAGVDEHEEKENCNKVNMRNRLKYNRGKMKVLIQWSVFVRILGCLIARLTVEKLKHWRIWSFKVWKWCVLVW